ncbi:hypothetical protein [Streptomyces sp. AC512_CC834]|uniref:hypothetical protein n=1 Tax=Streptomyces sp. AC512_CC834 TaxID=2823691 RepID=UPI001C25FB4C|nr:hypothetical protein [Streptomyces sp. AC512_CC834]
MTAARRHHARNAASRTARSDREGRLALTFLAVADRVGPAWALREHAGPLLEGAGHRPSAITPDASLPSDR